MTSRTWCPSLVTNGKSPPSGPASPDDGLLHTFTITPEDKNKSYIKSTCSKDILTTNAEKNIKKVDG